MEAAIANALRLLQLALPAFVGATAARVRLFPEPQTAISTLNSYALHVGFPALIAFGLLRGATSIPASIWFWLLWPIALLVILGAIFIAPFDREHSATMGLVTVFGNVAYVGLPYIDALYGSNVMGPASLAVSIHVVGAVVLGPALLARAGSGAVPWGALAARIGKMPLFWAPFFGLLAKLFPVAVRETLAAWIQPLAQSAAPVAIFLLGVHLYQQRQYLTKIDRELVRHVAMRQVVAPGVITLLAWAAVRWGQLPVGLGRVHIILAAMPAAITTFSMAHHEGIGENRVAATIVWSSLVALIGLPLWAYLAQTML